jgi:hypothetical protein
VGNEQNRYPVPDLNKTMVNVTKEPSDGHKKTLKEGKFIEKILDVVNQNVQNAIKKFLDAKNKDHGMT